MMVGKKMIKKILFFAIAASLLAVAVNAGQVAKVDVGNALDALDGLGWSVRYYEAYPNDHYGGYPQDGSWRMVISPGFDQYGNYGECTGNLVPVGDSRRDATLTMLSMGVNPANQICIESLDGIASSYGGSDAFDVYVNDVKVGTVPDNNDGKETWKTTCFPISTPVSGLVNIKLTATGAIWNGGGGLDCNRYGQVAVSWIQLNDNPVSVSEPGVLIALIMLLTPPGMYLIRKK
jgi:hypothetical protein